MDTRTGSLGFGVTFSSQDPSLFLAGLVLSTVLDDSGSFLPSARAAIASPATRRQKQTQLAATLASMVVQAHDHSANIIKRKG